MGEPRRIVLKMSGEALASSASDETIDATVVERLAGEIAEARGELDLQLAVMVGGGNIWRGTTGAREPGWTGPPRTPWGCSGR